MQPASDGDSWWGSLTSSLVSLTRWEPATGLSSENCPGQHSSFLSPPVSPRVVSSWWRKRAFWWRKWALLPASKASDLRPRYHFPCCDGRKSREGGKDGRPSNFSTLVGCERTRDARWNRKRWVFCDARPGLSLNGLFPKWAISKKALPPHRRTVLCPCSTGLVCQLRWVCASRPQFGDLVSELA